MYENFEVSWLQLLVAAACESSHIQAAGIMAMDARRHDITGVEVGGAIRGLYCTAEFAYLFYLNNN
jgi:hypothetical protein